MATKEPAKAKRKKPERVFTNTADTQAVWKALITHATNPFDSWESFESAFWDDADAKKNKYTSEQIRGKAYQLLNSTQKRNSTRDPAIIELFDGVELPRKASSGYVADDWVKAQIEAMKAS